jgi:hypothetical protein
MKILNYTGADVGLTDEQGRPLRVLSSIGKAVVTPSEEEKLGTEEGVSIYRLRRGVVKFLPPPSGNLEQMYIVSKEVADAARSTRYDLLIVEDWVKLYGGNFYRKLINV